MAKIYVGSAFPPEATELLARGLALHDVIAPRDPSSSNLVPGAVDPRIADADIVFGQPPTEALTGATGPRWVHLTSAGHTRYAAPDVAARLRERAMALTTSSSVYAEPCATHALALVLSLVRGLPEAYDNQRSARGWPADVLRARSDVLASLRVLVLGYGAIGRRLVELLSAFRAGLSIVRAHPVGDEPVRTLVREAALAELAEYDVVVSTLPEGDGTRGFVDAAWLSAMRPGACFVNVGRGATVDQPALVAALERGALGGVALDVTDPEPLPPEHPLWSLPRCVITPHTAGGRREEHLELVRHFLANLARFEAGEPLVDRVL